ncbi:patatin-like phospholipase family protein [Paenibacillus agilis]|nr:patatin-like phospholipase family protein [Paenibacillus agilis]
MMQVDAVFEGGGVRGIAFIGAIEQIEAAGYMWRHIAGTSAGSIFAALLASGYTSNELKDLMYGLDYTSLLGRNWLHHIPIAGQAIPMLLYSGIYSNTVLEQYMTTWLHQKNVHTFADLPQGKLKIIASDVSSGNLIVFPDDLAKYGFTPSDFPIATAVRMSTNIPFFFRPYRWQTPTNVKPYYVVDGALLSNFPIWIFDVEDTPICPTFGFRLSEKKIFTPHHPIEGPFSLFSAMFKTMLQAHDQRHVDKHGESRTMFIRTGHVTPTDFDLSEEDRVYLYEEGKIAAQQFLKRWDFEEYKQKFRSNIV